MRVALAFVLLAALAGCAGRTLTVPPEHVQMRNDPAWKIASEPASAR